MRWEKLRDMSKDDLLALFGLETRRGFWGSLLPGVGLVGAGLLIGAGLGLMLAPRSGHELRRDLRERYASKVAGLSETPAQPM